MKEKQRIFGEEGVIGLTGLLIVEKLLCWWRLAERMMSVGVERGQEGLGKAMQTPLPEIPMTPGSVPPATPLPDIPSTPEPGVPATPCGKE